MSMNKNNTPEIIDSYEGYNLYKDTYGGYIAKHDFPLYVESISFSDDSYLLMILIALSWKNPSQITLIGSVARIE